MTNTSGQDRVCKDHPDLDPRLLVNPPGSTIYGKWVCRGCGKFINHARQPKTDEHFEARRQLIEQMVTSGFLNGATNIRKILKLYNKARLDTFETYFFDSLILTFDSFNSPYDGKTFDLGDVLNDI